MSKQTFASDTRKRSPKEWVQGLATLFIGLTIAHLGVSLFLLSELGSDTFTVMIQGISLTVGLSIGTVHVIALILLMIIMLLTTKGYVKPGTVVCAFCGGWIIDFFLWLFKGSVTAASPMWLRLLVMLAGCIILSLGMSIVIESNSGTGPNDLIAIILTDKLNEKTNVQFQFVRIACDVFFVVLGFLLGGKFGIGTIAAALFIGPAVQFFLPKSRAIIHRFFPTL
ncbi:MAG: YczE/YyaS/YitT family protein [Marvinbryantia sp.]|uniref:YczE/YyaS/YitT family protein n=1 Tax=Marvinbryantia sp. TaxID=2496532 RepID=UPI0025F52EED|nr:hypothetical protein [uncultured Marvinbryantia sp.]